MEPMIVPAVIAGDQSELGELLSRLRGVANRVMLDFMDGEFVSGTSLQFDLHLPEGFSYEAHLMVRRPLSYLARLAGRVETVILHIETLDDVGRAIVSTRRAGFKVMLAISPGTPVEFVAPYLREIDGVLVMTVEPGKFGADFLPWTLDKVRALRKMDGRVTIEVDGGMSPDNARAAREAGANIFALGSYIIRSQDIGRAFRELEEAIS
jgi:ribulose-phosphate 3-epimerase